MKLEELLTPVQVKEEAAASPERALAVSVKHWEQAVALTRDQFLKAVRDDLFDVGDSHGGLCRRFFDEEAALEEEYGCLLCPLDKAGYPCVTREVGEDAPSTPWRRVSEAYDALYDYGSAYICADEDWEKWQAAAKEMLCILKGLKTEGVSDDTSDS
ncbi:MAG: hypothetical protein HQ559_01715 [Lentisphaerae bacterium]|nr:hypothetical protein [Lentisphaerota bacterium]